MMPGTKRVPLPAVSQGDSNMTSQRPSTPDYVRKMRLNRPKSLSSIQDNVGGTVPDQQKVDLKDYKVTQASLEEHKKKMDISLTRLKNSGMDKVLKEASNYAYDFQFLMKGMYRTCAKEQEVRSKILDHMLSSGFISIVKSLWERLKKEADTISPDKNITGKALWEKVEGSQSYVKQALDNLNTAVKVLWNGTDLRDPRERLAMIFDDYIEIILSALDSRYLYPMTDSATHPQLGIAKAFLGTLHNFVHNLGYSVPIMKDKGLLKMAAKYRQTNNLSLKTKTIMLLSYLINEEDSEGAEYIALTEKEIKYLIEVMKSALEARSHHSMKYGYNADEVVSALSHIATEDGNKSSLTSNGILPLLVRSMGTENDDLKAAAANCLWALAFDKDSRQKVVAEPGCMDKLKALAEGKNEEVKKAAKGALWKIEGEDKHIASLTEKQRDIRPGTAKEYQPHVMISYQWDVQDEVKLLKDRLVREGFKIWIDIEQMSKSTNALDAMSEAVEKADAIILCMTEKYKESNPCRLEAEYAWRLGKSLYPVRLQEGYKPHGWLSMILGSTYWFDLTKATTYEEKMQELIQRLGDKGRRTISMGANNPIISSGPAATKVNKPAAPVARAAVVPTSMKCSKWSNSEVEKFLSQSELQSFAKKMSITGELLCELVMVKTEAPETYYKIMREELNMSWIDLLKFNKAITKLLE